MITADQIITKCQLLSEGGWHPYCINLRWWADSGWSLEIRMADNLPLDTPASEIPHVYGLCIGGAYEPAPQEWIDRRALEAEFPGVRVSGFTRAPDYVEAICDAPEAWDEQAEALIREIGRRCEGRSQDSGHEAAGNLWPARRWHRCVIARWASAATRELWARADQAAGTETAPAALPTPEEPVQLVGRCLRVLRPCGCITEHWRAPGAGGVGRPSKLRFGGRLAALACLRCTSPSST